MSIADTAGSGSKLLEMLDIIGDKTKYEGLISNLQEVKRQADERLALVGPAEEILKIREQVRGELAAAEATRRQAEEERHEILNRANAEGLKYVAESRVEANRIKLAAAQLMDDAKRKLDEADATLRDAELRLAKAKGEIADIERREAALIEFDASLDAQRKALEERAARFSAAESQLRELVSS